MQPHWTMTLHARLKDWGGSVFLLGMIDLICAQDHNLFKILILRAGWVHVPSFTEDNCVKCIVIS